MDIMKIRVLMFSMIIMRILIELYHKKTVKNIILEQRAIGLITLM